MVEVQRPDDRLTRALGISHPVIHAPMADTSKALVAAVSNAGGSGLTGWEASARGTAMAKEAVPSVRFPTSGTLVVGGAA